MRMYGELNQSMRMKTQSNNGRGGEGPAQHGRARNYTGAPRARMHVQRAR